MAVSVSGMLGSRIWCFLAIPPIEYPHAPKDTPNKHRLAIPIVGR